VTADPETSIDFSIRRSTHARRSRITIAEDAAVVVVLPVRAPARDAAELVARHRLWIERHVGRITARRRALATRPSLAHGRVLNVNGRPQIVRATSAVEIAALERRLRREARAALHERLAVRAPQMRVTFRRVTVRDQRTRWGSASRSGALSFNWRLVLCPPRVLDYVVVHELAHLKVAGHGRSFWQFVGQHFDDAAAARRWLRAHHDEIRNALD
jgi:predicted metal-dependent hydrolase